MLSRADFQLREDVVFLNHGSFGATPTVMLDEQRTWINRLEAQPVLFHRELPQLMADARRALASFLGCDADDLVFVTNSTFGTNVAAHALAQSLRPGDRILTCDHEYGACIRAWNNALRGRNVELDVVSLPVPFPSRRAVIDSVLKAVTDKTRCIFLSHITAPTALELPIAEICLEAHRQNIITVIDGSHAPGQLDLNLRELNADIYTANLHKWLCLPKGCAFLYVRRELQENFPPLVTSWGTDGTGLHISEFIDEHEYLGTRDVSAFLTTPMAVQWMQSHDLPAIRRRCSNLMRQTIDRIGRIPGFRSTHSDPAASRLMMGAVTLPESWSATKLKTWLYDEHRIEIVCQEWGDWSILRLSVHAYTTSDDLDTLVSALKSAAEHNVATVN